jgi:hypothetical protein
MLNVWHHHRAYKRLLPKWIELLRHQKGVFNNSFYKSTNVDGSPYTNYKNHYKLKRVFNILL